VSNFLLEIVCEIIKKGGAECVKIFFRVETPPRVLKKVYFWICLCPGPAVRRWHPRPFLMNLLVLIKAQPDL